MNVDHYVRFCIAILSGELDIKDYLLVFGGKVGGGVSWLQGPMEVG